MGGMEVETKFLRLFKPAALGDRIDGWRMCRVGGMEQVPRPIRRDGREAAAEYSVQPASLDLCGVLKRQPPGSPAPGVPF
jgi:hypothetical protein